MTQLLITFGILLFIVVGCLLCWQYRNVKLSGDTPSSPAVMIAVLFTSGLDGGFILLPLVEFPTYQQDANYAFLNPLAIELGFWGITAWFLYFVSTLYFLTIEPKLQLFRRPAVRFVNSLIVLTTCAFTLSLFLQLLPHYTALLAINLSDTALFLILTLMIVFALLVSTKIKFMTKLSQVSVLIFFGLILVIGVQNQFSPQDAMNSLVNLGDYLKHFHHFILPFNDYHEFYLAWWLTWTVLLGQFVAKFVCKMSPFKLLLAMVLVPLIPTAIWFSVLYHHFTVQLASPAVITLIMLLLAILFVVNSLDFMVANYSETLSINQDRLGLKNFVIVNTSLLIFLSFLFKEKLLLIQWTALFVIFICVVALCTYIQFSPLKKLHLHINNLIKTRIYKG